MRQGWWYERRNEDEGESFEKNWDERKKKEEEEWLLSMRWRDDVGVWWDMAMDMDMDWDFD